MDDQAKGFYFKPEAKIFAETYFNIGYNLYKSALPNIREYNKTEDIWRIFPALVNIAFSCEISMKLIYEKETRNMAHGHGLYDLFNKLSEKSRYLISKATIKFNE